MKGVFLIAMMIALLLVLYLTMKRTQEPVKIDGKSTTLMDLPADVEQKVNDAMKMETERLRKIQESDEGH